MEIRTRGQGPHQGQWISAQEWPQMKLALHRERLAQLGGRLGDSLQSQVVVGQRNK